MHPAYSVILFTTASGAGYGMLALLGLVGLAHGPASTPAFGLTAGVVALALIVAGLLSSTFHLGHPERAWRAFSQWRSSWLSREGVAAVVTFVPALLFLLLWSFDIAGPLALLAGLTIGGCAVTVWCTGMIYASLPTIRQWRHPLVVPVYLVFALATGACLLAFIAHVFGRGQAVQLYIGIALLVVLIGLKLAYWSGIDRADKTHTIEAATGLGHLGKVSQWEVPHTADNYIMNEMGYRVGRKHAARLRWIVIAGLAFAAVALLAALGFGAHGPAAILACLVAVLASGLAAIVERWLFFAEAQHVVSLYYGAERA